MILQIGLKLINDIMNLEEMYNEKSAKHLVKTPVLCTPELFFEKYKNGDAVVRTLIEDLQHVASDVAWFKEAKRNDEQLCIDFLDALNILSTRV